jgi:hypothetical protein
MKMLKAITPILLIASSAFSQVIYDIDFNAPGQPANQLVRTGAAPQFVSQIVYGSPMVLPAFGSLLDQPLVLNMVGNAPSFYYDQIQLNLPRLQSPVLDVAFDFTSRGLIGSQARLTVLFDTPSVRDVFFQNDGQIALYSPTLGPANVGSFSDGEEFRVGIHVDLAQKQWFLLKNGTALGSAPFTPDDYVQDIRISYGLQLSSGTPDGSSAAIDNLVISVPEPASADSFAVGICLLWVHLLRSKRSIGGAQHSVIHAEENHRWTLMNTDSEG